VRRGDDTSAGTGGDELRRELSGRFDIDVLGAERDRRFEYPPTFVLAAGERSALPGCAAGHDNRRPAAVQRAGNIGTFHQVEPQLDEVGVDGGIPAAPEIIHRRPRDRHTQLRFMHQRRSTGKRPRKAKKPPQH
jgi:hypothetical protein